MKIARARQSLEPMLAGPRVEAELLGVPPGAPLMLERRLSLDAQRSAGRTGAGSLPRRSFPLRHRDGAREARRRETAMIDFATPAVVGPGRTGPRRLAGDPGGGRPAGAQRTRRARSSPSTAPGWTPRPKSCASRRPSSSEFRRQIPPTFTFDGRDPRLRRTMPGDAPVIVTGSSAPNIVDPNTRSGAPRPLRRSGPHRPPGQRAARLRCVLDLDPGR